MKRHTVFVVAALASLMLLSVPGDGALNIATHGAEDMVTQLRKSIFVETAYLRERQGETCSSLDGPRCFAALLRQGSESLPLDGAGLGTVPETLLRPLGSDEELELLTPEHSVLESYRQQIDQSKSRDSITVNAAAALRNARGAVQHGVLHFMGLMPDRRVPLSFSQGLPDSVFATWDGRWVAKHCQDTASQSNLLTAPANSVVEGVNKSTSLAPSLPSSQGHNSHGLISAENVGSASYLRFSRPVVVRSILARWQAPADSAPPGIVGGRLGLQNAWATHLDPSELRRSNKWIDVSGNQFRPVDEVAFIAASGLEIGAVEIAMHGAEEDDEEQSVLLLKPILGADPSVSTQSAKPRPQFQLAVERLTAASAPYVVSLHEAIENNWRLVTQLDQGLAAVGSASPSGRVAGLLNARSQPTMTDVASASWIAEAATNQHMFEHRSIGSLLQETASTLLYRKRIATNNKALASVAASAFVRSLAESGQHLPADIKKQLRDDEREIVDALLIWATGRSQSGELQSKKLFSNTPARILKTESESILMQYARAKHWQTKLDLLTAAFLHLRLGKTLRR